ncbi:MAG: site-2 protease family protein, partial [Oscillospiraceae bacterium]|nr:site-2 protease family protein [Oscillospiraceae bacterium]
MSTETMLEYIVRLMIIFLISPIHEFAHAWSAHLLGDDTAKYSGRLTLSPFAHVDIWGALLIFFFGFGWA